MLEPDTRSQEEEAELLAQGYFLRMSFNLGVNGQKKSKYVPKIKWINENDYWN